MANYNAPQVENKVLNMPYTGVVDTVHILKDGLYKLEVWGAGAISYELYGFGGYSVGYIVLKAGDTLYVCNGERGTSKRSTPGAVFVDSTFNGGGFAGFASSPGGSVATSGGGATHIAIGKNRGVLSNYINNKNEILIVAGGASGPLSGSGAVPATTFKHSGNSGGGTNGAGDNGGTQTKGGTGTGTSGEFGRGGNYYYDGYTTMASGGGGGWYGGSGSWSGPGGGGSGYIGGVPAIIFKGKIFSPSTENGKNSGHGKSAITLVAKSFPTIYYGTKQINAMCFGAKEITDMLYGNKIIV